MSTVSEVSDLERRKRVRIRLRPDLGFTEQRYEGRIYHVVKDPVSMRYYRFKEHERYLLGLMDGQHTLEEAQKSFEQRFRPERLTLEDLEAFTSQLLQAGLAQNETPGAGKQIYDRFKKRRRKMIMNKFMNVLYIKIPLVDPDALLNRMVKPLGFIFTRWFLYLSVAIMLSALFLVMSQWNSFIARLPAYQEFFSFKSVFYLWIALGVVKIIHEFGHGLSCKTFKGEVHEMGALFLVFSPCLYCNVSDSWMLPNKWHRIIISAAGIYVELIIAALSTFVWWWSEPGSFASNMSMSLMVVCSVSTLVFNANPLMRFDGYYVLADWLEIPNLREKSNRFLMSVVQEYGLGIEVPPQPYMTRGRQILFVTYAIAAYLYRWFITFVVLVFMFTFLEPYKLGAISFVLGIAAMVTMIGQPLYQLFKNVSKRGRLPDMKPRNVSISAALLVVVIGCALFIPLPLRVKGVAYLTINPQESAKLETPEFGGFLKELVVQDGQRVKAGDVIAILHNPQLDIQLRLNEQNRSLRIKQLDTLNAHLSTGGSDPKIASEIGATKNEIQALHNAYKQLAYIKQSLVVRATCNGVVMRLIKPTELGKFLEKGMPICEIGDERDLRAILLVPSADKGLIQTGDAAWIRIHGRGYNYWPGHVANISANEAKAVPYQLTNKVSGNIASHSDPETKMEIPQSQHYVVEIKMEQIDDAMHPGVVARVKIECEPKTIWWRINRYLDITFNWGL